MDTAAYILSALDRAQNECDENLRRLEGAFSWEDEDWQRRGVKLARAKAMCSIMEYARDEAKKVVELSRETADVSRET